jgi:hypothetical protein
MKNGRAWSARTENQAIFSKLVRLSCGRVGVAVNADLQAAQYFQPQV